MSNTKIKLIATRPMYMNGKRCETGDIVAVDAAKAAGMLESGRCRLLDPADAAAVTAAGRRQAQDLARAQRSLGAAPGDPWQPLH